MGVGACWLELLGEAGGWQGGGTLAEVLANSGERVRSMDDFCSCTRCRASWEEGTDMRQAERRVGDAYAEWGGGVVLVTGGTHLPSSATRAVPQLRS